MALFVDTKIWRKIVDVIISRGDIFGGRLLIKLMELIRKCGKL